MSGRRRQKRRDTMNWFKFLMVDMRLMKSQKAFLIGFPLFAVVVGASSRDMIFLISYLCFGVMIVSTTPFLLESKNVCSFIHLLPGNDRDKVSGRYACFLTMLLAFAGVGYAVCIIFQALGYRDIQNGDWYISMAVVIASAVIGSLQFIIFYVAGRGKGEQWLNIVRVIPAFLFFFVSNYAIEWFTDHKQEIGNIIGFINQNKIMLLIAGVVLALLVFFGCIAVSVAVTKRRDVS